MSDERYWITDPNGHRRHAAVLAPKVGEMVEFMGEQVPVLASMDAMMDDLFICDMCNADMPTIHVYVIDDETQTCEADGIEHCPDNGEPIPVKCVGSYALCRECAKPHEAESRWPMMVCGCPPCMAQAKRWEESWVESQQQN